MESQNLSTNQAQPKAQGQALGQVQAQVQSQSQGQSQGQAQVLAQGQAPAQAQVQTQAQAQQGLALQAVPEGNLQPKVSDKQSKVGDNLKLSLTVAIIAHNEQDRLPATLLKVADIASEIVIINSMSTDNTVAIAQAFGAKVHTQPFVNYVDQKNSLIPFCTQDWILFLDADEVLNDELKAAIVKVIKEDRHEAFEMNRLTFYLGKLLKHAWQPNYRLRLVRRDSNPRWEGDIVHESLAADAKVARLPGFIIHYSYRDVNDHFQRTVRYAKMSAQSYIRRHKKPSLAKILFSPVFSFIKLYFIKLGFLDGRAGLVAAWSAFIYTFLKYVYLWEDSLHLPANAMAVELPADLQAKVEANIAAHRPDPVLTPVPQNQVLDVASPGQGASSAPSVVSSSVPDSNSTSTPSSGSSSASN